MTNPEGKTILFSGVFDGYKRPDLEAQAIAAGFKLLSGVSKNLHYLVAGEKMGPDKRAKAEDLGVPIISLDDFFAIAGGAVAAPKAGLPDISTEDYDSELYTDTLLDKNMIYTMERVKEPTPHVFYPKKTDVFVKFNKEHKEKILPLLQIDLSDLNPAYKDKVCFIYYENVSTNWIVYQLTGDSKIGEIKIMDGDSYIDIESDDVEGFEEEYEYTHETLSNNKKKAGYFKINAVPFPDGPRQFSDYKEYEEFEHKQYESDFGPYPTYVQNGFCAPVMEGSATPFLFVARIYTFADKFGGLIGTHYYLFYHPETRTVAQLMQMT